MGLGGDDADDLVKGLGLSSKIPKPKFEITPAPAADTGAQDVQPASKQGTATTSSAPAEPVKPPTAIAATSGDEPLATSESKSDKSDETQSPSKDSAPTGAVGTQDPVQTTITANSVTQTNNAEVGKPDGELSPKPVQGAIPEAAPAVAPSNESTQLPSATDDEKEVSAAPKANVAPSIPAVASSSPQTESRVEESRAA